MKPFGVRLAAGAVTILLGAIMAAQAQKDHQAEIDSAWTPNVKTAPPEIVPMQGSWADQGDQLAPAVQQLSPFDDVQEAVQLVQHTEPAPEATQTFSLPDSAANVVENVAEALMPLPEPMGAGDQQPAAAPMDLPEPLSAPNPLAGLPANMADLVPEASSAAPAIDTLAQNQAVNPANMLRGEMESQLPAAAPMPKTSAMNSAPAQMIRALALPGESQQQPAGPAMNHRPASNDLRTAQNGINAQLPPNRGANPNTMRGFDNPNQYRGNEYAEAPAGNQNFGKPNPYAQNPANNNPAYDQNAINRALQYDPNAGQLPANNTIGNTAPPLPANNQSFRGTIARPASHALPKGNYAPATGIDQLRATATYAQPGDRRLEGVQAPSVVIHKRAPAEVKVGKPASFVIQVRNTGSAEAMNVRVHDRVPQGMRMVDATPKPVVGTDGEYVWQLGSLSAGEERQVTMQLIPEKEGELGSVARVTFEAAASVRTRSTLPMLKITQRALKEVLIGQQLEIELEISNPGTGEATGVILQEDVPDGLDHPKGRQLDNLIGTLRPGDVRRQMLRLKAVAPGMVQNTIRLKGDDGLEANHTIAVKVISPQLQVALTGPKVRYLERQATFNLDIANTGTAPAENVEIAAFLDRGFTFVSTQNEGTYDPSRHAVYWSVQDLPVGARGQIPLVLLPVQEGPRMIQLEAKADLGIVAQSEAQVAVNSLAELTFSISDTADPIEVNGETTYEIRVKNSGSRPDSNVQVKLQFPPGLEVLGTDVDATPFGNGGIAFRPKASLAANGEVVYQIKTRGLQPGTHLIKAIVNSQESRVPVTKEESTMVYDDRANIATQPGVGSPQFQR